MVPFCISILFEMLYIPVALIAVTLQDYCTTGRSTEKWLRTDTGE